MSYELCWDLEILCASVLIHFSCVWLFVTPQTVTCQAPLSMGFSRQEYWSGLPCPPPGDLLNPGTKRSFPSVFKRQIIQPTSPGSLPVPPVSLCFLSLTEHFCCERVLSIFCHCFLTMESLLTGVLGELGAWFIEFSGVQQVTVKIILFPPSLLMFSPKWTLVNRMWQMKQNDSGWFVILTFHLWCHSEKQVYLLSWKESVSVALL